MSRVQKNIEKKVKGRKRRLVTKIIFLIFMSINLCICILVVNQSTKEMLGEDTYKVEENIKDLYEFMQVNLNKIGESAKKFISQLNI